MHQLNTITAGLPLDKADSALILLHGRGADATDILGLANHLPVSGFALLAPQATNHTWYPYSFMQPAAANEPWLSSAIDVVQQLMDQVLEAGIPANQLYLAGFSQGACLTLEFAARHAKPFGGVMAFTGGLIGDRIATENYSGNFEASPIFIGSSNPDPHVPVERVQASAALLRTMGARVTEKIYPNMGHTISLEELEAARQAVFSPATLKP